MFPGKLGRAVFGAIVDQVVALVEVLVVRQDQPFGRVVSQVLFDPQQPVRPGGRVSPGRPGQDVGVESFGQLNKAVDRAGKRVHQREDSGYFVLPVVVLGQELFGQLV